MGCDWDCWLTLHSSLFYIRRVCRQFLLQALFNWLNFNTSRRFFSPSRTIGLGQTLPFQIAFQNIHCHQTSCPSLMIHNCWDRAWFTFVWTCFIVPHIAYFLVGILVGLGRADFDQNNQLCKCKLMIGSITYRWLYVTINQKRKWHEGIL